MILLTEKDFVSERRVRLGGRRLRHLIDVHRAGPGDELAVGILDGDIGTGIVTALSDEAAEMEVSLDTPPPPPLQLTLVLSLPRPKMLRRVLFSVSTLGVKKVYLINSFRVEKAFWQSPLLSADRVVEQLILGLEQAKDTRLPDVLIRKRFKPFVEDELPAVIGDATALLAHPAATQPCPRAVAGPVVLAVGPEGGFIQYEVDALTACGFRQVTLGSRILRVETAVPFLISRLT